MTIQTRASGQEQARAQIQAALAEIRQMQTDVSEIGRDLSAGGRNLQQISQDLRSADWPIRRAEWDNGSTDVSREGHEIDRLFRDAERETSSLDRTLFQVDREGRSLEADLQRAEAQLERVRSELGEHPAAGHVEQSQGYLAGARRDNSSMLGDSDQAQRSGSDIERELRLSDPLVSQIQADRPGQDVSFAARQLQSRVSTMGWNLRDAERGLSQGDRENGQTDGDLRQAEQALNRALSEL